jgi:hypothetical protein
MDGYLRRKRHGSRDGTVDEKLAIEDNRLVRIRVGKGEAQLPRALARTMLRFAKRGPTWTRIMWMQRLMTQLWSSDTRYNNTRSPLYVRRRRSTSTNIDKR